MSNWFFDITNEELKIWDHNGNEITTSPIIIDDGVTRDQFGIPIEPSFYDAVSDHIINEYGFAPSSYVQEATHCVTYRQVIEGSPDR